MPNKQKKKENSDEIYCQSISKSISDVIRFSLDESFRKHCFELFGVSSTADTKKEIYKKLMGLIESKSSKSKRDIEDEILTEVDPPDQLPDTSADEVTATQTKSVKKNWLLISSQQFNKYLKSKRTCFYCRPLQQNGNNVFGCSSYSSCEVLAPFKCDNSCCKQRFKRPFNSNDVANKRHFSQ